MLLAALATPVLAVAGPLEDQIVAQLQNQGFDRISVSRTLLGRTRFVATNETTSREIVLDPRTGEILRDLLRDRSGGVDDAPRILDQGDRDDGDDGPDDDDGHNDDDDDDDDDNGHDNDRSEKDDGGKEDD